MSFYDTLGVAESSSDIEIKKAYRTLSLRHHPDRGGDAEKFKEVSEAYETLSDPQKRRQYDSEQTGGRMFFSSEGAGIDAIFQNLFQGAAFGPGQQGFSAGPGVHIFHSAAANHPFFSHFAKPQSVAVVIHIELEQVFHGCVVPITYDRFVVRDEQTRTNERRTLEFTIPAGVENDQVFVIPDVGNVVQGITGDVRITVKVEPHAVFTREGSNLHHTKKLSLREALCGCSFDITLLCGRVVTIKNTAPPIKIIYHDMQQVCAGFGLPLSHSEKGALIIHFHVMFPESLTADVQTELARLL